MIRTLAYSILMGGLMAFGIAGAAENHAPEAAPAGNVNAIAVIHPSGNHDVHGVVQFESRPDGGVRITADLQGLPPNSTHGFHIHEYGDCSAADLGSAGGHYNPQHHPHGGPQTSPHHAGDLGNVKADAQGNAHLDMTVHDITIDGRHNPIIGRAVIVHEGEDDLTSQPSGDAGSRIGCGVIGLAE